MCLPQKRSSTSFTRGYHLSQCNRLREAIDAYSTVAPSDSAYVMAQLGIAACLYDLERFPEAIVLCEHLIENASALRLAEEASLSFGDENPFYIAWMSSYAMKRYKNAHRFYAKFRERFPKEYAKLMHRQRYPHAAFRRYVKCMPNGQKSLQLFSKHLKARSPDWIRFQTFLDWIRKKYPGEL